MNDSILETIKKLLGIEKDYTAFDVDIIVHINSVLMALHQIGIDSYSITGYDETWYDYIGDSTMLEAVKSYIYLKVRILFDPPSNGTLMEAINNSAKEFEWRIFTECELNN